MARQKRKGPSESGLRQRKGTQRSKEAAARTSASNSSNNGKARKSHARRQQQQCDSLKTPWVRYAILTAVTVVAYLPTYTNGYVWDDEIFSDAPQVQNSTGLYDIWLKPGTIQSEAHYWPMVYTSFWLDYRLWGSSPFMSHLINVLIHAANSCLLHRLLRRVGQRGAAAWISAIVFALHPVHVESVAWAIERKDTLSALFYLAALLVHPSVAVDGFVPSDYRTVRAAAVSLGLYALAMLTKSIVVSLPAVLLLLPWFVRGEIRRREFMYTIPFFVVGLAIAVSDMIMMIGADYTNFGYSLLQRVMIASRAVCFYLGKIVLPTDLVMMYPLWSLRQDHMLWATCVVVVASALLGLFALRHRLGRGPITGLLFFGLTIGPCLCLIDYSYMQYTFVADRYQYLAMAGPIAVISSMAAKVLEGRDAKERRTAPFIVGLLVAVMGVQTYRQSRAYRDNETFFGYVAEHNPRGFHGWHHLGNEYIKQERQSDAVRCLKEASIILEDRKDDLAPHIYRLLATATYINYGMVLSQTGHDEEGIEQLGKAVAVNPRNIQGLNEMGNALGKVNRREEAIKFFRRTVEIDPEYAFGWGNMGADYARLMMWDEAVEPLKRAVQLNPLLFNQRMNLATVYIMRKQYDLAINQYGQILALQPDNTVAKERMAKTVETMNAEAKRAKKNSQIKGDALGKVESEKEA